MMTGEYDPDHPSEAEARATAGAVFHYLSESPERMAEFARWAEHCPGDLDNATVWRALCACHDLLSPECSDPLSLAGASEPVS
jgi:hypothetical protein